MRSAQERILSGSDSGSSAALNDPAANDDAITVEDIRKDAASLPQKLATDISQWLDWQSRMIHGVQSGAIFLRKNQEIASVRLAAFCSVSNVKKETEVKSLASIAWRCFRTELQIVKKAPDADAVIQDHIAFPVLVQGKVLAVVALTMSVRSNEQTHAVVQLQQWCVVWLEKLLEALTTETPEREALQLECLLALARDIPLPLALHSLCNLLAARLGCSSVSVGLCRGLQVVTVAVSHQQEYDRRTEHIRELENAMEECVDQRSVICLPTIDTYDRIEPTAHINMVARQAIVSVCSVPLITEDQAVAVISCTRDNGDPMDESFGKELWSVGKCLAPLIQRQHRLEKPFGSFRKAKLSAADNSTSDNRLFSPTMITGLLVIAIFAALFIQVDHRISSSSVVEGTFQQAITVPFPGQLRAVHARAGDQVAALQVLAELNDAELILEREKWQVEHSRQDKEYQLALASRDRAQVGITAARLAQSEAELQLLEIRLSQTKLVAPFPGLLVSGDWSQSLGAPVETGQLMFEIVPLEGYRLILEVDEHDIAHISPGQKGSVRLTGLPSHPIDIKVVDVLPIANAHDGANYFRVEANVQNAPAAVRPGMHGVAKVIVGRTSVANAWFGSLFERLRLTFWLFVR